MELKNKENRIWSFLDNNKADGLLLSKRDSFAWISCGGTSGVDKSLQNGVVDVLFLDGRKYLIASEIEKYRFMDEELPGKGFLLADYDWFEGNEETLRKLIGEKKIISDTGANGSKEAYREIQRLRFSLEPEEIERLMSLSGICVKAMSDVCKGIRPGDTEWEIGAELTYRLMKNGVEVPVCMIASDERIAKYRHPVSQMKKVGKHAMVVLGAERNGLVVSISRIVHFGKLEPELLKKHEACLRVDAEFISNTIVGAEASGIFRKGIEAYEKCGYPDEWKYHHQGGAAGYRSREYIADFNCREIVQENQVFSWNPTIAGTKSEDTILVTSKGQEIITEIEGWPTIDITTDYGTIRRPDILIL